jgi:hypothetical protein
VAKLTINRAGVVKEASICTGVIVFLKPADVFGEVRGKLKSWQSRTKRKNSSIQKTLVIFLDRTNKAPNKPSRQFLRN